jgi:colanic acid biosynthesis protein WcaH
MKILNTAAFETLIDSAPLVSVDFIITDIDNNVLLGRRSNAPAKGMWCVPGGRIYKNETMMQMIKRKLKEEVGLDEIPPMSFLGIYEHFYPDSAVSLEISTHYIAISFGFQILDKSLIRTCDQHEEFQFIAREKALKSDLVPIPIKNYLQGDFKNYLGLNIIN